MKTFFKLLIFLAWVPSLALAQELVPATSEDLEMFDRQLADSVRAEKVERKEAKKSEGFGQAASGEAKRLREATKDGRENFRSWVSSQKKQSDQKKSEERAGKGAGSSSSSAAQDARTDAGDGKGKGRN